MELNKIDLFTATMSGKLPSEKLLHVRHQLEKLDDNRFPVILSVDYKDPMTLLIVSWFAGIFGVDRFMLGQTGLGVAKLLTLGGLFIWAFVDLFLIMRATRETNYEKFQQAAF